MILIMLGWRPRAFSVPAAAQAGTLARQPRWQCAPLAQAIAEAQLTPNTRYIYIYICIYIYIYIYVYMYK